MINVLVSLAICMIVGAGVLGWLEPKSVDYAAGRVQLVGTRSQDQLRQQVQHIVAQAGPPTQAHWQVVQVVALPLEDPTWSRVTLTALTPRNDYHFLIWDDGQLQSMPAWQRQEPLPLAEGVIRVAVVASVPDDGVAQPQWATLRTLLEELSSYEASVGLSASLPVQLDETVSATKQAWVPLGQHLRALLLQAGYLS